MKFAHTVWAMAVIGASALTVLASSPAHASGRHSAPPVRTITSGLDGPYGLDIQSSKRAVITEGDTGEITAVNLRTGAQRTLISGLQGSSGVATHGDKIYVVLGGGGEEGPPPPSKYPPASLLVANKNGSGVRILAI
jgi:hypothetical protein